MSKPSIKVGDVFTTNNYGDCVVIEYIKSTSVRVRFINTGYETLCTGYSLKSGKVKDLKLPTVYGVGYLGVGDYKAKVLGETTKEYSTWKSMIRRCYDKRAHNYNRYGERGVTVCDEWLNFQNFAQWCEDHCTKGFQLDKDLRKPDSKLYSPETCEFVPSKVNKLLTSRNKLRGDQPVGVSFDKPTNKYLSQGGSGNIKHGRFDTPEEAFQAYKEAKEEHIKKVAVEEYSLGNISEEVYNTLMNWEVVPYPD